MIELISTTGMTNERIIIEETIIANDEASMVDGETMEVRDLNPVDNFSA